MNLCTHCSYPSSFWHAQSRPQKLKWQHELLHLACVETFGQDVWVWLKFNSWARFHLPRCFGHICLTHCHISFFRCAMDKASRHDDVDMPVAKETGGSILPKATDTMGRVSCHSGSSLSNDVDTSLNEVDSANALAAGLADWLAEMELTHRRFLRATPAYRITQCMGRALRARGASYDSSLVSKEVEFIRKFVSHSWQSKPFWKTLSFSAAQ